MPATKSVEDALRALGWSPVEHDSSIISRAWAHPEAAFIIRTPRADWMLPVDAFRIR